MSSVFKNIQITRKPTRRSTTSLSNLDDLANKVPSFNRLSAPPKKQACTEVNLDLLPNTIEADNLKPSSITSLDEESFPDVSVSESISLTTKSKGGDTKLQTSWDFAKKSSMKGFLSPKTNMGSTMVSFNHPITTTCATSQMKCDEDFCVSAFELTPQSSMKNLDTIHQEFSQLIGDCKDFNKHVRKVGRKTSTLVGSVQNLPVSSKSNLQVDTSAWKKDTDLIQHRKQVKEDVTKFRKKFQEEQKIQDALKEICPDKAWVEDGQDEKLSRIERLLVKQPQTFRIKKNKTRFLQISERLNTYDFASDLEKIEFKQPEAEKSNKVFSVGRLKISSLENLDEKPASHRSDKSSKSSMNSLKPENASDKHVRAASRNSGRPQTLQNFEITEESSCSSEEADTLEPGHKNISLPAQTVSSVRVKRFSAKYRVKETVRFGCKIPMEEDKLKAWEDVPDFNLFKKTGRSSRRRHTTALFE